MGNAQSQQDDASGPKTPTASKAPVLEFRPTAKASINLLVDCLICSQKRSGRNPRQLICKHGFCTECLSGTGTLLTDEHIQCPICWKVTPLDENGILGLPLDCHVSITEEALKACEGTSICALCRNKGVRQTASARCGKCEVTLCKACVKLHKEQPDFAEHVIAEDLCEIHVREYTHACVTCHIGLCYECQSISDLHSGHEVCEIKEVKDKTSSMITDGKRVLFQEMNELNKIMNYTKRQSELEVAKKRQETKEKLKQYIEYLQEAVEKSLDQRDQYYYQAVNAALQRQTEAHSMAANVANEIKVIAQEAEVGVLENMPAKRKELFKTMDALRHARQSGVLWPRLGDDCCYTSQEPDKGQFVFSYTLGGVTHGAP